MSAANQILDVVQQARQIMQREESETGDLDDFVSNTVAAFQRCPSRDSESDNSKFISNKCHVCNYL